MLSISCENILHIWWCSYKLKTPRPFSDSYTSTIKSYSIYLGICIQGDERNALLEEWIRLSVQIISIILLPFTSNLHWPTSIMSSFAPATDLNQQRISFFYFYVIHILNNAKIVYRYLFPGKLHNLTRTPTVSTSSDSLSDLVSSISGFDDPRMAPRTWPYSSSLTASMPRQRATSRRSIWAVTFAGSFPTARLPDWPA